MLTGSYFNLLLVAVPLGFAARALAWGAVPVFTLNFLALVPLALLLGDVTEDLAVGGRVAGVGALRALRSCAGAARRIGGDRSAHASQRADWPAAQRPRCLNSAAAPLRPAAAALWRRRRGPAQRNVWQRARGGGGWRHWEGCKGLWATGECERGAAPVGRQPGGSASSLTSHPNRLLLCAPLPACLTEPSALGRDALFAAPPLTLPPITSPAPPLAGR